MNVHSRFTTKNNKNRPILLIQNLQKRMIDFICSAQSINIKFEKKSGTPIIELGPAG